MSTVMAVTLRLCGAGRGACKTNSERSDESENERIREDVRATEAVQDSWRMGV